MATASELPSSTNSSSRHGEECDYLGPFLWQESYLTDHTYNSLVALLCAISLTIIPTILLNALVILVAATSRPLRTKSNLLLACLAGTDLLRGVLVMPVALAVTVKRAFSLGPFCTIETVFSVVFVGQGYATLTHVVLISIDRYIAIKNPLRYRDIVTTRRIARAVFVAWAIAVFVAIQEIILITTDSDTELYSLYWIVTIVINSIFCLVCLIAIAYCYVIIFSEARRQKKRLQTEQLSQEEAKKVKKDNKAAHTLAMMLGTIVLCLVPSIVEGIIITTTDIVETRLISLLHGWISFFAMISSLLNPMFYCWRNKKLRRAFLEIFHLIKPENCPPQIEVREIDRNRSEIQPSTSEGFSMTVTKQEPVLLSISHFKAEEIVPIEETDNQIL